MFERWTVLRGLPFAHIIVLRWQTPDMVEDAVETVGTRHDGTRAATKFSAKRFDSYRG
jgi:hypothetical protein